MPRDEWRRYVAPAAFLLAVTVAVVLIHSGLQTGSTSGTTARATPAAPRKHVATTSAATGTTTSAKPAGRRFWTVQAGDTFGVISSRTGVPVATIEELNPNVKSTSLFIGQKIRLR